MSHSCASCLLWLPARSRRWPGRPIPSRSKSRSGETKLRAVLYKPDGNGPFAVVVGLHGCDGLLNAAGAPSARYRDWAQRLTAAGFAVVLPGQLRLARDHRQPMHGAKPRGALRARAGRRRPGGARAGCTSSPGWRETASRCSAGRTAASPRCGRCGRGSRRRTARPISARRRRSIPAAGGCSMRPGARGCRPWCWWAAPTIRTAPAECQQMVAGAKGRSARAVIHVYPGALPRLRSSEPARCRSRSGYAFSADGSGRVHTGTHPSARADALRRVPEWLKR